MAEGTKVGSFFIDLAVDAVTGNLTVKQLVSGLGELQVASVGTVGVLSKIADTLWSLAKAATGTAVEMSILQDITGADPKMAQQWEKAAQRINIHAGSITASIRSVNAQMADVSLGKTSPAMEFGRLGISPHTGRMDAAGHPIMKGYMDILTELAKSAEYGKLNVGEKKSMLGGLMQGANAEDSLRIINEMKAGKWHPESISVLSDKQTRELNAVKQDEVKIGQQLEGIFQKLLTGGQGFATVLESISTKLAWLDKWLESKQASNALGFAGGAVGGMVENGFDAVGLVKSFAGNKKFKDMLFDDLGFKPAATPRIAGAAKNDDMQAKLHVEFADSKGASLGQKEIFLRRKVSNTDVEHVTINAGNGGQGQ